MMIFHRLQKQELTMKTSVQSILTKGLRAAVDVFMPRACIVCGERLYLTERHICLGCLSDMPMTRFWNRSHNLMSDRFNALIQEYNDGGEFYSFACALFFFQSQAGYRHILYNLKYKGNIKAGEHFASILGRKIKECPWFDDVDTVVPVPLHWTRRWKRGYNQAEIIARIVARHIGVAMRTDLIKRKKITKTQTRLEIKEKAKNVSDAFKAYRPKDYNAHHILIIDDLFTTGNTLHACFTALREVFPPSVRISVATLGFVGTP